MEALAQRRREERQRLIEQAWLTAMLGRADKIVPLHELLAEAHPRDPAEVAAEQRARLRALSATLQKRSWSQWLDTS
ncbi:hypothetical protein KM176_24475 [Pseudooceanicola sp. CBS1P-1]|nr:MULTISPECIES: hypothetical protein [Pseudooceanicola]MBT9387019.1 hypothetical protein [Pseudooceanicola endophyticus]